METTKNVLEINNLYTALTNAAGAAKDSVVLRGQHMLVPSTGGEQYTYCLPLNRNISSLLCVIPKR